MPSANVRLAQRVVRIPQDLLLERALRIDLVMGLTIKEIISPLINA